MRRNGTVVDVNEEDVEAQSLPEGVEEFVEGARLSISERETVPVEKIIFTGMTLFFSVDKKKMTFEVVKT